MKKLSLFSLLLLLVNMTVLGAGWTDDGSIVRLTTSSDEVGVGTSTPDGKLHISSGTSGDCELIIEADTDNSYEFDNPRILFRQDGGVDMSTIEHYNNLLRIRTSVGGGDRGISFETGAESGGYTNAVERMRIAANGNVGIGTDNPDYKLDVNGTIRAKEIKVETGWSDFVFADSYKLMPLDKLEKHIKANKSLPGIPTEKEVLEGGVNLGEMQAKFLEKIEELTLYTITQEKRLAQLEKENKELKTRISALEK